MKPKISVIIPVRPQMPVPALAALQAADYPPERVEVLVVEGECPPRQQNQGAGRGSGEVLYFIDDDSLVAPETLQCLAAHYRSPETQMVGGPSLTPAEGPLLSRCIGYALGTWLGAWTMRARYAPVGVCRPATEKELIGCNLSMRRETFQALGGFCEQQFPNNETELVCRWRAQGGTALYDPELAVWRTQRQSLGALARQFFSYGRGRVRQMRRAPARGSLFFLWPAAGLIYLAAAPPLAWALGPWVLLPPAVYLALVLLISGYLGVTQRTLAGGLLLPLLFIGIHAAYGCGLIYEAGARRTGQ
jgi:succinoglycan biosynthesis protein ExoA